MIWSLKLKQMKTLDKFVKICPTGVCIRDTCMMYSKCRHRFSSSQTRSNFSEGGVAAVVWPITSRACVRSLNCICLCSQIHWWLSVYADNTPKKNRNGRIGNYFQCFQLHIQSTLIKVSKGVPRRIFHTLLRCSAGTGNRKQNCFNLITSRGLSLSKISSDFFSSTPRNPTFS